MRKTILAVGATLALAAATMGQTNPNSYAFPSPWNPAGKSASEIKQWITITWDDNQYSGAGGSYYEPSPGAAYSAVGRVDGIAPQANPTDTWTNKQNPGTSKYPSAIVSTGNGNKYGLAWAFENLGKGKNIPMTFNMITGLFVNTFVDKEVTWSATPTEAVSWQRAQSVLGYWTGEEMGQPWSDPDYYPMQADSKGYLTVAVAWGREMRTGINPSATNYAQQNFITEMVDKIRNSNSPKHEIGNHTIDHMETNSFLGDGRTAARQGKRGFAYITSGNDNDVTQLGKGMTPLRDQNGTIQPAATSGKEMMPWGIEIDQALEYGTKNHALVRGWGVNVGRWMEKDVWKRYVQLSEDWLTKPKSDKEGGLGMSKSDIKGFRAPRLEVNSNLYFALKELDYQYDCGLEEGYEKHVNGQNFLWPYTTDNGIRNSWTKTNSGERVFIDTMPQGFWIVPENCLIVPPSIRSEVVNNWNSINRQLPTYTGDDHTPAIDWDGKVTCFDFNAWVLYGMTKTNFLETMKYTLDQRMSGNKAPFQYGAHTDYYTPIYDNGTLQNAFNLPNFGQSVTKGWNDWKIRQEGTEEWVDYAIGRGAQFLTARALVDSVAKISKENWDRAQNSQELNNSDFELYVDGDAQGQQLGVGTQTLIAAVGAENQPTFVHNFAKGAYGSDITHIELDYKSQTATAVRLIINEGNSPTREVILAHRYSPISHYDGNPNEDAYNNGSLRNSGRIPLTSFDFLEYFEGTRDYSSIDPAEITGIEIVPLAPDVKYLTHGQAQNTAWYEGGKDRTDPYNLKFEIANIKVWTGIKFDYIGPPVATTAKVNGKGMALSLAGISKNALKLNISSTGKYDVKIFSTNGRLLQSFNAANLTTGVNTLKLNNLASGVYLIKVQGIDTKQQLTKSAMIF